MDGAVPFEVAPYRAEPVQGRYNAWRITRKDRAHWSYISYGDRDCILGLLKRFVEIKSEGRRSTFNSRM